jgi:hypothetical protein
MLHSTPGCDCHKDIQDSYTWKIQPNAQKKPKPAYRPPTLSSEQEDAVVALLESWYHMSNFTSQRDVLSLVESEFGKL